jgi:hypothetical protein
MEMTLVTELYQPYSTEGSLKLCGGLILSKVASEASPNFIFFIGLLYRNSKIYQDFLRIASN